MASSDAASAAAASAAACSRTAASQLHPRPFPRTLASCPASTTTAVTEHDMKAIVYAIAAVAAATQCHSYFDLPVSAVAISDHLVCCSAFLSASCSVSDSELCSAVKHSARRATSAEASLLAIVTVATTVTTAATAIDSKHLLDIPY